VARSTKRWVCWHRSCVPSCDQHSPSAVRVPSWFSMTRAVLPSITATHEFVVPRSMPMISPALALASHRRGARTGAGAAAARTRRDNSRDIDSMLAPAAGDCDRVSHALLALFGALV